MGPDHRRREPIVLLGATSMTGWAIVERYRGALLPYCNPFSRLPACDEFERVALEDEAAIAAMFARQKPGLVIHCGGICDVDRCEAQPEFAELINVASVELLLRHLPLSTRLVYCSSDHVFGAGGGAFDESAEPQPITVYGATRARAEALIAARRPDALIVRSGLSVGRSIGGKTGHLDWLRHRHARGLPMTVVAGEVRSAVWASDLAERIWQLGHSEHTGLHHITAARAVARPELARYLNARFDIGATFEVATRAAQKVPHIGHVELATHRTGPLSAPLPEVVQPTLG